MAAQLALYGGLGALQLAGGYFASQNVKETARLNREIAEMNAEFAELDAHDALVDGFTQQARYQSVVDETLSQQRLALTSADVDVGFGTAAQLQEETRFISELNNMEIEKQTQEMVLGYKTQARDIRLGGDMQMADADRRASELMFQSIFGAAQTGLTGYTRSL